MIEKIKAYLDGIEVRYLDTLTNHWVKVKCFADFDKPYKFGIFKGTNETS